MYKKLILIFLSLRVFASLEGSDISKENVFLLSCPGSGNTWVRYCIEFLTKRPTGESLYLFPIQKENLRMDCPLNNNFPLGVDYNASPVIKIHEMESRYPIGKNDYLIVIIRNYKETLLRHLGSNGDRAIATLRNENNLYTNTLRAYHNWPENRRLLLYYEDFLQFPEESFYKLADFFQTGHELIPSFLKDLEMHRQNGIKIYEHTSITQGKDFYYHSNRISQEKRNLMDTLCEEADPELFKIYLFRYKEDV